MHGNTCGKILDVIRFWVTHSKGMQRMTGSAAISMYECTLHSSPEGKRSTWFPINSTPSNFVFNQNMVIVHCRLRWFAGLHHSKEPAQSSYLMTALTPRTLHHMQLNGHLNICMYTYKLLLLQVYSQGLDCKSHWRRLRNFIRFREWEGKSGAPLVHG